MNVSKKVVLYSLAIIIALLLTYDFGLDGLLLALVTGFLVSLMIVLMVVFMRQLNEKRLNEKDEDHKELLQQDVVVCFVCGHQNNVDQIDCEKCGSPLENKKVK